MNEQRLLAMLHGSPTGRGLLGATFIVPTATADPTEGAPADGTAIAWSDGATKYLSIYYAAIPAWGTTTLT